jgi:23S rRNA pseudouridine955/2504/2580 synthase
MRKAARTITTLSVLSNHDPETVSASTRTAVRAETIAAEHAGRRIDNFLLQLLKPAPKSLVYKLLRSGQVRVNGSRRKPDYRLNAGDVLRIPPVVATVPGEIHVPESRLAQLAAAVLYEDEHFLIVNKPAGMASHGGTGVPYGAIEVARRMRPEVARLDLAHRLDRDTSGCLILTKQVDVLRGLHSEIRDRQIIKRYCALLYGRFPTELKSINATLRTSREQEVEKRARVRADGKASETIIENVEVAGSHSLVQMRLVTGRMHQIRAHAQHIDHSVAGDRLYGNDEFNREMAARGLKRLFLHAMSIGFEIGGQRIEVTAPLPLELTQLLNELQVSR